MKKIPHKNLILALGLVLVILIVIIVLVRASARLKAPESIAYDSTSDSFLISNTLGKSILQMDQTGKLTKFITDGLTSPKGILIDSPYLYIADLNRLHVVDIPTASFITSIDIEDASGLNDVAMDKNGYIYLTDTPGNCIYRINVPSKEIVKIESPLLEAPNGIVYDRPRSQMLIVGFTEKSPILSLATSTQIVSVFMNTIYNNLDGIAIDDLGRIYFSSWSERSIYMLPQEQNRFEVFRKDLQSPADIYYHSPSNELLVPLWEKNRIERISLN